jgi:photosystem II stability/assembly factor-like uncharacterized protein
MHTSAPFTRRKRGRCVGWCGGLAAALTVVAVVTAAVGATVVRQPDVLDTSPLKRAVVARTTVTGIAASGSTLIAVGPRGTLLRSTDSGGHWQAAELPLSADLTSVRFSAPDTAWAVGHDAVILKSTDSGASWVRVLDGRLLLKTLQQAAQGNAQLAKDIERTMSQSASPDVWPAALFDLMFIDAERGFAVGAFGCCWPPPTAARPGSRRRTAATTNAASTSMPSSGEGGRPYIAGEQGVLLRLDAAGQRFVRVETPYKGSYFGLATSGEAVLAYGLRGNAFLSSDAGASWRKLGDGNRCEPRRCHAAGRCAVAGHTGRRHPRWHRGGRKTDRGDVCTWPRPLWRRGAGTRPLRRGAPERRGHAGRAARQLIGCRRTARPIVQPSP